MTSTRRWALAGFFAVIAVALLSPLEAASHTSLTAHMVQHVLLIGIAAPCAALALPRSTLAPSRWLAHAVGAVVVQSIVIVGWHAPSLFDGAVQHRTLHGLEHVSMVGVAGYLWWVLAATRPRHGEGVITLFLSTAPLTLLGFALMLSTTPWYSSYRDVSDQQVAGAVMWAVGGAIALIEGVWLFAAWLRAAERDAADDSTTPPETVTAVPPA